VGDVIARPSEVVVGLGRQEGFKSVITGLFGRQAEKSAKSKACGLQGRTVQQKEKVVPWVVIKGPGGESFFSGDGVAVAVAPFVIEPHKHSLRRRDPATEQVDDLHLLPRGRTRHGEVCEMSAEDGPQGDRIEKL
jgi:hypothetical protein